MNKYIFFIKDRGFSKILIKYFLLLFACLVFPITILNLWYGHTSKKDIQEELMKINELKLEQAYESIDSVVQAVKGNVYDMSYHKSVQYLAVLNSSKEEKTRNEEILTELLKTTKKLNEYIENISVYLRKTKEVFHCEGVTVLEEYEEREWLMKHIQNPSSQMTFEARKKNGRYPYLLTVTYPINARKDGDDGVIVIYINVQSLAKYLGRGRYKSENNEAVLIVMDAVTKSLIYSDEYQMYEREEEIVEEMAEPISIVRESMEDTSIYSLWDKPHIVSGYYASKEDFIYINISTMESYEARAESLSVMMRNVIMITGGLCVLLAFLLAVWVYKPIRKTIQLLDELSMLTGYGQNKRTDEVAVIQRSIQGARTQFDHLNDQMKEKMISLQSAQMCALQSQINPHFLYNTLEAIGNASALLLGDNYNGVTEMIYALAKLMRISLNGESYLVPLEEELNQVKLYAKLLDFRYRDRIRLHIDFPEEMIQEKILKLTLQPLIENSLQHGFEDKRVNGEIWIRGEQKGEKRYVHVTDNGIGISDQEYEKLLCQLKESAIKGSRHLGLRNVDQRLKLIFGEECGLILTRPSEGGFCVTVIYDVVI